MTTAATSSEAIVPFTAQVEEEVLEDLRRRLRSTRWPEKETSDPWEQGVPLEQMQKLCAHWLDEYDWRACEAKLNSYDQFHTRIDGLDIHFLHVRSPEAAATPMLLTHGFPGSVTEFLRVIGPLTDPAAHGGGPADAFHLVIPSLPGYGFSERPAKSGWGLERIARAWSELMRRLGYSAYVAQGGDMGAAVAATMGAISAPGLTGIHVNFPIGYPTEGDRAVATDEEKAMLERRDEHAALRTGYVRLQSTKPQTLGYGLVDSPVAQAAWIYEKFRDWTDCDGDPLTAFDPNDLLDNITLYWVTGTGLSSARLYWENRAHQNRVADVPTAFSSFPQEIYHWTQRWAERTFPDIGYWGRAARGGHFAAFEVPEIFVDEVRAGIRALRNRSQATP